MKILARIAALLQGKPKPYEVVQEAARRAAAAGNNRETLKQRCQGVKLKIKDLVQMKPGERRAAIERYKDLMAEAEEELKAARNDKIRGQEIVREALDEGLILKRRIEEAKADFAKTKANHDETLAKMEKELVGVNHKKSEGWRTSAPAPRELRKRVEDKGEDDDNGDDVEEPNKKKVKTSGT